MIGITKNGIGQLLTMIKINHNKLHKYNNLSKILKFNNKHKKKISSKIYNKIIKPKINKSLPSKNNKVLIIIAIIIINLFINLTIFFL